MRKFHYEHARLETLFPAVQYGACPLFLYCLYICFSIACLLLELFEIKLNELFVGIALLVLIIELLYFVGEKEDSFELLY